MTETDDVVAGTQQAYAVIAQRYAERQNWAGGARATWATEEMGRLAAALPTGALVGDVGCGPGHDTVRLRSLGLRAHGFDLSHAMLTTRGVPGQVRADLRRLPLRDGTLDGLWCVAVLLHIPRTMLPAALAEFHRVLRPGGLATISIAEGDGEGWEPVPYQDDAPGRYFVYHGHDAFTGLLAEAGFEVLNTTRRSTHRDWLSLLLRRDTGVH